MKDAQPAAEGAAPHLVGRTEELASALRKQLKTELSSRMQSTLEQMKWPSKDMKLAGGVIQDWSTEVGLLLDLQTASVAVTPFKSLHPGG